MKKVYYILLATMLLMAGCTDELTEQPISPEQIYFGVVIAGGIEVTTRSDQAVQSDTVALVSEGNPDVKLSLITSVEENSHSPFVDRANTRGSLVEDVVSDDDFQFKWFAKKGANYVYRYISASKVANGSNLFYEDENWPSTEGTYDFYAFYPNFLVAGTYGLTINTVSDDPIEKITYNMDGVLPAAQSDLMVAYASANHTDGTPVSLVFHHACTAVVLKVGSLPEGYKVKKVTFENIYIQGDCSITNISPYSSWDLSPYSPTDYMPYSNDTGVGSVNSILVDEHDNIVYLMMIPQSLTSSTMKVLFSVDGLPDLEKTVTLGGSWEAGKVVTYTITRS